MNQKYTPNNLLLLFVFIFFSFSSFGFENDKTKMFTTNYFEVLDDNVPIITGYLDSTCDSELGRTLEIYVKGTVDFTNWELQIQENGNGFNTNIGLDAFGTVTDAFLYVTNDALTLDNEFGIDSNFIETTLAANGNDAFQIVDNNDNVVDRYGLENVNGSGQNWQYQNSYFYRANGAEANSGNFDTFNWLIGNVNSLNNEGLCNGSDPFSDIVPFGTYQLDFTATVQIIHNSADPNAEFVDVYLNGEIFVQNVEYRTATSFLTFPAETPINIDIAPQNSTDVSESILNFNTTLTSQEKYILVADGVLNPSQFDTSVNSPIDLSLEVFPGAREEALAIAGNTDILFHNGTTDVESLDFDEVSIPVGTLVGNSSYTDFSSYIQLATSNYVIQPKVSDDGVELETYDLSLSDLNLQNKAVTLLTSGFFDPENNQDAEGFGLWLVTPDGGDFIELPFEGECVVFDAPYSENFEDENWIAGSGFQNENDQISECWSRTPGNDNSFAWLVAEFETVSGNTGPSTGFDGDTYIYAESSDGNSGDQAFIELPVTDLGDLDVAAIEFYYHMFGNAIGTLSLEVKNFENNNWTQVFSISGQQQLSSEADWTRQEVDLSSFSNQTVDIRFVATRTSGFAGDIAIDKVSVLEATTCLVPTNINISNISDVSAQLNWNGQDSAIDGYNWYLFAENDDPENDTPIQTGSVGSGQTSADVSALQPNTTYDIYLEADCGNGDLSNFSAPATFTTASCPIADQCAYTFELTDDFGDGWNGNIISIIQDGVVIDLVGENFTDGSAQTEIINICNGADIEVFWNDGGQFQNEIGFEILNPFDEVIYTLAPGEENDDTSLFTFTSQCTPPTCPAVTNFSISNILENSVELSWDAVNNASDGYNWYIFEEDEDPETSTPFASGTEDFGTNQVDVSGLLSSTAYDAYIEADCGNGDLSELSDPISFNTNCATFSTPFNENFDGNNWVIGSGAQNENSEIDLCWTRNNENANDGYFWGVFDDNAGQGFNGPNSDLTGGNYIYSVGPSGSNGDEAIITSPLIDLDGLNTPGLIFNYFMYGFGIEELRVEVKGVSSNNWVQLTQIVGAQQNSVDDDWEEEILSLDGFTDQIIQFRFIAQRGFSTFSDIAIDQVSVDEIPSCSKPIDLAVQNLDLDSADLSWTEGDNLAIGYEWQVFLQGDDPISDTPVASGNTDANTFSANISGLSASTTYVAYVQAECSPGEFSFLSNPILFSTPVCSLSSTCDYTFLLTDTFGDGWNGNTMSVFQDGQLLQILGPSFTNGNEESIVLSLCDGADVELFWNNGGQFTNEVGIEILNNFDEEIFEKDPGEGSQDTTLTNFLVACEAPEGCFPPSNFAISNVESDSVELTWDNIGSAISGYNWFIFNEDDNPQNTPPIANGSTNFEVNSVTVPGLSANTAYKAYVRSNCGFTGVSPISDPLFFETPCTIFSTPFEEDFDDGEWVSQSSGFQESINDCWDRDPESDNNEYQWFTNDLEAQTETGSLEDLTGGNFLYADATFGSQGDEAYLSIPTVDLSSLSDPSITFYYFMYGETIGNLSLEVKLSSESNWTSLSSISGEQQSSKTDNWVEVIVDLNQFSGETEVDIRFKAVRGTTPNGDIQIDAVNIDELPTCFKPTNLEISNITVDSAQLSFDGDPSAISGYEWLLFLEGDDPEQDTPVATGSTANTNALLNNLAASTNYEVYLRSDCGNGELSELSLPVSFFTETCNAADTCVYEITLLDSFGDGWNEATMQIIQEGNVLATIGESFDDGSQTTENVSLCDDSAIEVFWNEAGDFSFEIDIIITNPFGEVIYDSSLENISPNSTIHSFDSDCTPPVCEIPNNLVANNITQTSVQLQWDAVSESLGVYNWFVFEAGDDPESDTPVQTGAITSGQTLVNVTNLNINTNYEAYIQVECEFNISELSPATTFITLDICEIPTNLSVSNITQNEA
ncbi:fibronectin type III domain-containing protein, partial [Psychroflexus aestuariivivens]|uniref:fibronectin type III domain-containing protein n=1 Tax=Psychroflexus aestuariivivens TaxID=1795040 RepID=UPI000FDA6D8C